MIEKIPPKGVSFSDFIPEFDTFAGQDIGKIEATDRWNGDL